MKKQHSLKTISIIFAIVLFVFSTSSNHVEARTKASATKKPITVLLDGKQLNFDVPPVIQNNRVMVPYRVLLEAMGASVQWNKESGTIRSTLGGETIQLNLYSKVAYVNGKKVSLDAAAMVEKDRTLVPLRFISENFHGQVNWSDAQQRVTILLNNSTELQLSNAKVYLNQKLLNFTTSPLSINGRAYLPLEEFVNQMEETPYWTRVEDRIYIDFEKMSITAAIGQKTAMLNNGSIETSDAPIEKNGTVYVSVRYIAELFVGSFNSTNNEIKITINNNILKNEQFQIAIPKNIPNAFLSGDRRLIVSDNPENLSYEYIYEDNVTLWEESVTTYKDTMDYRVFGWHMNNLGKKVKLGITIENRSTTNDIEIVNLQGIYKTGKLGWGVTDVGLTIAESTLKNDLPAITMANPYVQANSTEIIQAMEFNYEELIGFLSEFSVRKASGEGNLDYSIRVVMTQSDEDLTLINFPPIQKDYVQKHPRGTWNSSYIQAELPAYVVGSEERAYSISNGVTDNVMSTESSLGNTEMSFMNPGHFGATYKVKIPIINNSGESKTVQVRLSARGGLYTGAVKSLDKVYRIINLKPATEVVKVIDYKVTQGYEVLELEIMHGAGSYLPLAIDVVTIN